VKDETYFALTKNLNNAGVLAVTNFGSKRSSFISNRQLSSYSFLTIDTLRSYGADLRSGVVAGNGLLFDRAGRSEFTVTKGAKKIKLEWNEAYDSPPVVIAFPNWLGPSPEDYPMYQEELNYAIRSITDSSFEISHASAGSSLGFSFAVIGDNVPTDDPNDDPTDKNKNINYGYIGCSGDDDHRLHGVTISSSSSVCSSSIGALPEMHPAVKIVFDTPFSDIPAVIATPFTNQNLDNGTVKCIVESITRVSARVKCAYIRPVSANSDSMYYQSAPFTFVAVGNAPE
jgi:hypothetical protein